MLQRPILLSDRIFAEHIPCGLSSSRITLAPPRPGKAWPLPTRQTHQLQKFACSCDASAIQIPIYSTPTSTCF